MRFVLLLLTVVVMWPQAVVAQTTPKTFPYRTLEEATAGEPSPALWRLADEDTTIYLFGTVHLLHTGVDWRSPAVDRALGEMDVLYVEADVSGDSAETLAPFVLQQGIYRDGEKLSDFYSQAEQDKIDATLRKVGLRLGAIDSLRPWFANVQIGNAALMRAGGKASDGVEALLMAGAERDGIPLRAFETPREQISILAQIADDIWAEALLVGLPEIENATPYFATLINHWYTGDLDGLADLILTSSDRLAPIDEAVLYQRNERWAATLAELMLNEQGTIFVAVGAGHMVGSGSLVAALEARSFEVERIDDTE